MRFSFILSLLLSIPANLSHAEAPALLLWQKEYKAEEVTGENVIVCLQFNAGSENKDNSGHGHDLVLRGQSRFVKEGKFGSGLECFPAGQKNDVKQGATTSNKPRLSPSGAFTIEVWMKPKSGLKDQDIAFLIDCKYYHYVKDLPRANTGYCLYLQQAGAGKYHLIAGLGFNKDSEFYRAPPAEFETGKWHHVAFTYDGKGTGRHYLDGKLIGELTAKGRGSIQPSVYPLTVGDRVSSIHAGFPGFIDQIRISKSALPFSSGKIGIRFGNEAGRTVFHRLEKKVRMKVHVTNDTGMTLTEGKARISLLESEEEVLLPELATLETHDITVPINTSLRQGSYDLKAKVTARSGERTFEIEESSPVVILPRPLPNVMPVVLWGGGDLKIVTDIGFTHQFLWLGHFDSLVWKEGKPTTAIPQTSIASIQESLNRYLAAGVGAVIQLYPGRWIRRQPKLMEKYSRIDRSGTLHQRLCALSPKVLEFGRNVGASVHLAIGNHPAAQASLIHSEVRDYTQLCFHEHDQNVFKKHAGFPIPREAVAKTGVHYSRLKHFPRNRIIKDNHRLLTYYKWFWKSGDGWNRLHTEVHKGLKPTGKEKIWTFFDPAVRVPPIWGSGGGVDVISQWTYVYPDPIKMGQSTDELFAMADGAKHDQKVMKMTQVIWYRQQTAPNLPEEESKRAPWEKEIPDARFITIAPDHMREAFWCKIARPIRGIMYHGWASLVKAGHSGYRFTNPETRGVLTELVREIVRPLGPTLLQVPDRRSDVAVLESFTSSVFAGHGSWGWSSSWIADMHLILQWAQIQPRIIYEETILRDGLDRFKVLVMPHCDVLPESVHKKIDRFQRKGGLIISDEHLAPALSPDILVESYQRKRTKGDEDKAALQAMAAKLRSELDDFYVRYGESSNPDVVVRFRKYRDADYLFAINDKRTFGDYIGHHGMVMEKGLPNTATLLVRRSSGHVYDLVNHQQMPVISNSRGLQFDASFEPGGGRLFMITDQRIESIKISVRYRQFIGRTVEFTVSVDDESGKSVQAVVPMKLEIHDRKGRPSEVNGHYGVKDGRMFLQYELAPNDLNGEYTIRATELASRKTGVAVFRAIQK